MNLLESLAGGLRGAAGVLSPAAQQITLRQDEQAQQQAQQRKQVMAAQLIKAAEMGAIEPEAAQRQLQALGYGQMPVGPSMDVQKQRQAMAEQARYRAALAGLGDNPTEDQILDVSRQFAGPDKALDIIQRSQDRRETVASRERENRERLAQQAQQFQERIEQQRAANEQRLQMAREGNASREQIAQMQIEGRQQLQAMVAESRRQIGALAGSLRQPPAPHYTTDPATGNLIAVDRDGSVRDIRRPTGEAVQGPRAAGMDQKQQLIGLAETIVSDLETMVKQNPRSTVGLAAGAVRGIESAANTVFPGSVGSQATLANQKKEQLVQLGSQILGGSLGKLSNQDTKRMDTAIGAIRSGTPEGLTNGLKAYREIINTVKRGGAAPEAPPAAPSPAAPAAPARVVPFSSLK